MRPDAEPVFDPALGIVRLSRAHLDRLAHLFGSDAQPTTELDGQLRKAGALGPDGVHPGLRPLLEVVTDATCRVWIRQWSAGTRRVVEIVSGPRGLVVVPGGSDPDSLQDVRYRPRPTALARTVADVIGLDRADGGSEVPNRAFTWDELLELGAIDSPSWWSNAVTWHRGALFDVIGEWSGEPGLRSSIMVLARIGEMGWATVARCDGASEDGPFELSSRRPAEIWLGLCAIAQWAVDGPETSATSAVTAGPRR